MNFSCLSHHSRVYLDHNATTPLASFLAEKVPSWLGLWGNASSIHSEGRGPKTLLREARRSLAEALNVHPLEMIFTSGGSEGNNAVIKGVHWLKSRGLGSSISKARNKYLVSAVEHPSVVKSYEFLRSQGAEVLTIPVSRDGQLDMEFVESHLDDRTLMISVMLANNETGHIFPIKRLAQMAHEVGALIHTDAVQGFGKIPVDLKEMGVDFATFSAHKFYALKGAGFIYARRGTTFENLIHGGGQERGRRGGTENVMALESLGAMTPYLKEVEAQGLRLKTLRDNMEKDLLSRIPGLTITGKDFERLPNTSNMVIEEVDGESLLMNLDLRGYSVSTGAACSSGNPEPSPVLLAMGLSRKEAQSSLRIGLGWSTTQMELERFADELVDTVVHLRKINEQQSRSGA